MTIGSRSRWIGLHTELQALRTELLASERRAAAWLDAVHPEQRASARNLIHYLALRRHDLRELQTRLAVEGLSSLGRSESYVLASIESVLCLLDALLAGAPRETDGSSVDSSLARAKTAPFDAVTRELGQALIERHAERLLGPRAPERRVRIMVTLPREAATDPSLALELVRRGMDCARINAAHDTIDEWRAMARHVREAARSLGRACTIAVDLPGPKCRTGALRPGPQVHKLKPQRGLAGEVLAPARAWLSADATSVRPNVLPVTREFLSELALGASVTLRDTRGRKRRFRVSAIEAGEVQIESDKTAYVQTGTVLHAHERKVAIGPLPALEEPLLLRVGDVVALTRSSAPGRPAREPASHRTSDGGAHAASEVAASGGPVHDEIDLTALARIPCAPPELVDMVRVGESVWLDDGKIGGVVTLVDADQFLVRITAALPAGDKLHAGKGINLPDTDIRLPALTADDLEALSFAAECADIASVSFIHDPADVHALFAHLVRIGRPQLGVILKIETRRGFECLPELLLAAMRSGSPGVMIARGDLAVECGFERLAELQEEILWLSEAAHVPVVWATQVLESVAKTGRPTRAEVSDASLGERAECVMLNKGPYIAEAVTVLDDILRRMSAHQDKKTPTFRSLHVAETFQRRLDELPPRQKA